MRAQKSHKHIHICPKRQRNKRHAARTDQHIYIHIQKMHAQGRQWRGSHSSHIYTYIYIHTHTKYIHREDSEEAATEDEQLARLLEREIHMHIHTYIHREDSEEAATEDEQLAHIHIHMHTHTQNTYTGKTVKRQPQRTSSSHGYSNAAGKFSTEKLVVWLRRRSKRLLHTWEGYTKIYTWNRLLKVSSSAGRCVLDVYVIHMWEWYTWIYTWNRLLRVGLSAGRCVLRVCMVGMCIFNMHTWSRLLRTSSSTGRCVLDGFMVWMWIFNIDTWNKLRRVSSSAGMCVLYVCVCDVYVCVCLCA